MPRAGPWASRLPIRGYLASPGVARQARRVGRRRSGRMLGHVLVAHLEIGVDVLHVVVILEAADELDQGRALLGVERYGVLRLPDRLDRFGLAQRLLQRGGDLVHRLEAAVDPVAVL